MTAPIAGIILQARAQSGSADVSLQRITTDAAQTLGTAFAALEPWSRYPFSPAALSAYLAESEPGAPRYAIMVGTELAGALGIRDRWLRGPYLQFLGILPAFQRHGIGRLVIGWFETHARDQGERNIWVAASDFNDAALGFYRNAGFVPVARLDGLVRTGVTEILLRKNLCGD